MIIALQKDTCDSGNVVKADVDQRKSLWSDENLRYSIVSY